METLLQMAQYELYRPDVRYVQRNARRAWILMKASLSKSSGTVVLIGRDRSKRMSETDRDKTHPQRQ